VAPGGGHRRSPTTAGDGAHPGRGRCVGLTPLRWLTAQRLLEARRLLEATNLPIDEVAERCGLGTPANLRLHLSRDTATTPTAYRRTYQGRRGLTATDVGS